MCGPAVRSRPGAQFQTALIARRIQQQQQLRQQFAAAKRREALGELQRKREAERQSVRDYLAWRDARREAEAAELASLSEQERLAHIDERNESCAASKLKLAESLRSRGRPAEACKWLERLVDEYPETAAAGEAREILAWLPAAVSRS